MNTIIQTHSAQIVTNSYGYDSEELDPAQLQMEHSMYLQAGLEGIGLYFSSGDEGDNTTVDGVNAPEPSYASSDPLVTGVGGTSLATPLMAGMTNAVGSFASSTAEQLGGVYGYGDRKYLTDITYGSCNYYSASYAIPGWDFCTGLGTPKLAKR